MPGNTFNAGIEAAVAKLRFAAPLVGAMKVDDAETAKMVLEEAITAILALRRPTPALRCTGCGSTWTDAELAERKKTNPNLIACCPERDMHPTPAAPAGYVSEDDWADVVALTCKAEAAEHRAAEAERDAARMRAALEKALEAVVLSIAFHGRDAGTDRHAATLESLCAMWVGADTAIRAALRSTGA